MIRLQNDDLGRLLHNPLYRRIYTFCEAHCPELPAQVFTDAVLTRLYTNDLNLHLLVTYDDMFKITEHAVIDVQTAYGNTVIHCHQLQRDKGSLDEMDKFMQYLDDLKAATNAVCISFSVTKNSTAYQKRYGYKIARTVMVK